MSPTRRNWLIVIGAVIYAFFTVIGVVLWQSDAKKRSHDPYAELRAHVATTYLKGYDPARADARRNGADPSNILGPHPGGKAVVVNPRTRKLMTGVQSDLPVRVRAVRPGDVTVVVWMDREKRLIGHYSGGSPAYRWYCHLTYTRVGIGALLGEEDVTGSDPPRMITGQQGAGEGGVITDKTLAKSIVTWMTSSGT